MLGRPVQFDFSGEPPDPDWIVKGLLERGTIAVTSADTGAGKSLICKSMATCVMQGKSWLGRPTSGRRVMFIDEENFLRVIHGRFRALGLTNADRENLRYFLRLGVSLGASDWVERVLGEMETFRPDVLFIDTAAAATAVDMNDNSGVARLFAGALRPLADMGAAVNLLHHERKIQQGWKRNAGQAMMGARQWAGQADAHIALKAISDKPQIEPLSDGGIRRTYRLELEMPKNRDGHGVHEKIQIVSEHDAGDTRPRWMRVEKAER